MLPRFVRAPNPIWYMVDLVGRSLNDEYYAFFLTNTIPYMPQAVYQDINGAFPWPFPLQFQPSGTLPNNLYFPSEPGTVYRIEIRHGNTQTDPLIWEINDFIPFPGGESPDSQSIDTDNQVTNPQFQYINFTSPLVITAAGTYNIAPGWDLIVTGIGTSVTVTQLILTADQNRNSNPAYALQIVSSGFSSIQLRQRFNNNGGLFANNAVTMSALFKANDGIAWPVTLNYAPSGPANSQIIASGNITINSFQPVAGADNIRPSINTQTSDIAFVDMLINFPANSNISISNTQMIGQDTPVTLSYEQTTSERQTDHLFHYYKDSIIIEPKKSILTGWNFALNPSQFRDKSGGVVATQTEYIADQTILHQEAAGNIIYGFGAPVDSNRLFITPVDNSLTTRFALIQYVHPNTIKPYWGYIVSSLVRSLIRPTNTNSVKIKMRLIYRATLPATISAVEPVASWAGVDPVFSAGWTAIAPLNDPSYTLPTTFNVSEGTNALPHFNFDHFQLPTATTTLETLGIVIYTVNQLKSTPGSKETVLFDKISLVPNLFAIDSHPLTYDDNLRECEYYYEKSYPRDIIPGTSSLFSQLTSQMFANFVLAFGRAKEFTVRFKSQKGEYTPSVTLYSPTTGVAGDVDVYFQADAGLTLVQRTVGAFWTIYSSDDTSINLRATNTSSNLTLAQPITTSPDCWIAYQYTVDSRLGR